MMGHPYGVSAQRDIFIAGRRRKFHRRAWVGLVVVVTGGLFLSGYVYGLCS